MAVLAVLAVIWMLDWGQVVLIPIMLAILISYAQSPLVNRLHDWRIPRARRGGCAVCSACPS